MKTSLLSLFLIGAAYPALSLQTILADDNASSGQAASTNGAPGTQGQRIERIREAFAQLGLTDAQKEQIRQIRASVTDLKERREEILNVLTPEQKAKLRELREEYRTGAQPGADTP